MWKIVEKSTMFNNQLIKLLVREIFHFPFSFYPKQNKNTTKTKKNNSQRREQKITKKIMEKIEIQKNKVKNFHFSYFLSFGNKFSIVEIVWRFFYTAFPFSIFFLFVFFLFLVIILKLTANMENLTFNRKLQKKLQLFQL